MAKLIPLVSSVSEFVNEILERNSPQSRMVVYRGHGSEDYKLSPSIFRTDEKYKNEHILLRELIASHPDDFANDNTALEMLVRMQHFSLPTRLLDVTFNPLVALYFACEPADKKGAARGATRRRIPADGEVVILGMPKTKLRYFDSDTVSCLANLARLRFSLKETIDTNLLKSDFNGKLSIKRLIHFIRQEKNGFEPEIKPKDLDAIILVKPKQNNRRILAQAGAFFVFGMTKELVDPNFARIERIKIASGSKASILGELDKLGINEKTLFPDIERAARYITGSFAVPINRLLK